MRVVQVHHRTNCPLNAVTVSYVFCILVSLISLGSEVAFNAIISLQLLALISTYCVTIGCLIWRRCFGKPLPAGEFSLGRLGLPVNISAIIYSIYLIVFVAFPVEVPVTLATVNWAPVIFVGVIVVAMIYYWLCARREYEGPVASVQPIAEAFIVAS